MNVNNSNNENKNEIKYLSEMEYLKSKNKNNTTLKKKLDGNIFINYWINKYLTNSINKFYETIKYYKESNDPNKNYLEKLNFYKEDLKKDNYNLTYFDIIFEAFFPKPFDIDNNKMMILEKMKELNMNINIQTNKNLEKNDMNKINIFDINKIFFEIDENNNNIYIVIKKKKDEVSHTHHSGIFEELIKYKWGEKQLFLKLLKKMSINEDIIKKNIDNNFFDKKPIKDINYNLTYDYFNNSLKELKNIYQIIKKHIDNYYFEKNESLEKIDNILKKIYELKEYDTNNFDYVNNKTILKEYKELCDINTLFSVLRYIKNYIYQFLSFDSNIYIKIQKLYEIYYNEYLLSYDEESKQLYQIKLEKKKNIYYNLGKNNFKTQIVINKININILKIFNIIYDLQQKISISENDLFLSLIFHQYDYSIIYNEENKYFIRRDIDNYYLTKNRILENIENIKKEKREINFNIPFLLNNLIFLDIDYQLILPFDLIYNDKSFIIDERLNSEYKNNENYLLDVSLNKNFKIMNYDNEKKMKKKFSEKNIINTDLFIKNISNTELKFKNNKIDNFSSNSNHKEKLLNLESYYNIYEEKYLNPIQDFKPSKYAYCSLYYGNNQYFLDAMLFGYSLYLSGTKFDRILICTPDVIVEQRKQLSRFYNRIFIIKSLDIDPLYFKSENRWYGVFNKLYAFYLDEYEKIFLMDTDMIIQKSNKINQYDSYNNLDLMFEKLNTPCGMCYDKEYILKTNERIPERLVNNYLLDNKSIVSAGVYLIKPSKDVFMDIIQRTNPNLNKEIKSRIRGSYFPEEAFLAEYFKKDGIYTLGAQYSFTPIWLDVSMDKLGVKRLLESIKEEDIVVVHYVGYKNWTYLISPYCFLFEKNELNKKIEKYKKLWCLLFMNLENYCKKNTIDTEYKNILSLINYCKYDKISFKN